MLNITHYQRNANQNHSEVPILIPNELPHKLIPSHMRSTLAAVIEASSRPDPFQWHPGYKTLCSPDLQTSWCLRPHGGEGGLTSLQPHGPEKIPAHARLAEGSNLTQNTLHQLTDGTFHCTTYKIGVLETKWFFTNITCGEIIISVNHF